MRHPQTKTYLLAGLLIGAGLLTVTPAFAQQASGITGSIIKALGSSNLPTTPKAGIEQVVGQVIQVFLSMFGIIFLVLMIYGGYKWMMAAGREEEVSKAKDLLRAAVIGLAIVLSAYVVTVYVVSAFTRASGFGQNTEIGEGGVPINYQNP